ncbi:MAG: hypothetical protein QM764_19890 [Chitinophagaceae bacterium]
MTKSGKSVFYFGFYILLIGILLCIVPMKFNTMLNLPEIPSGWGRLIGLLVIILAGYYFIGGRNNLKPFIKGTIYLRLTFITGIIVLFAAGQMPKEILLIGLIDLLGAIWTAISVKAEAEIS